MREVGRSRKRENNIPLQNSRKRIETVKAKALFGTTLSKFTQKDRLLKLCLFLHTLRRCWYYYTVPDIKLPTISQQLTMG